MPITRLAIVAAALFLAGCATPVREDATPYEGTWNVNLSVDSRHRDNAVLSVAGRSGTWRRNLRRTEAPCASREKRIEVQDFNERQLTFRVFGSEALQGCPDWSATLKRIDQDTLDGYDENGIHIVAHRR